jgi:hypothetical protein
LEKEIKNISSEHIPFLDYTLLFYVFIERLFHALKKGNRSRGYRGAQIYQSRALDTIDKIE